MKLQTNFENAVNAYIDVFAKKQRLTFTGWLGEVGSIAKFGEFLFNFQDIKLDIDYRIAKYRIIEWHDHVLATHEKQGTITFQRFIEK